jgi:hypothetical protein
MSLIGSIVSKIFNRGAPGAESSRPASSIIPTANAAPVSDPGPSPTTPPATPSSSSQTGLPSNPAAPSAPVTAAAATEQVDVEAVLTAMASQSKQQLNWQRSIVDLLKLLDLDSSLQARKELAGELHYTGDTNDSAQMNVWLHKQVMKKLEENGGKVPESLKDHA